MNYQLITLEAVELVGKTFEFPTSEIQTINYEDFYKEVCMGYNPSISYGIFNVAEDITRFTVAIKTDVENNFDLVEIKAGEFFEFEIDSRDFAVENQYVKCFEQLVNDSIDFDRSYSIQIMDRNFNPMNNQFTYKYYLKK